VVRVVDPRTFSIGDTRGAGAYLGPGGRFTQVKLPRTLDFSPLAAMLAPVGAPGGPPDASAFLTTDWAKLERPVLLHAAFYALHGLPGGLPAPGDEAAVAAAVAAAGTALGAPLGEADAAVVRQLARGARGSLAPLTAALGGVAAQEVIKASTHRLTPVKQWVYFDVAEALPPGEPAPPLPAVDVAPRGDRYDGQACVLGRAMQGALGGLRYFLVGAGAIGCEILKNWALMGVGAGPGGMVTVTDMDRIERSNLSRQFLFRAGDVKKPKSSTAVLAAARMNPALRGRAFEVKAGPETEGLFNDAFWKGLSGACNALDNGPARLYVDSRCVRFNKPLLESGTLGTFGSTQVVVPGLTEHYGATVDPPEKGIPVCTLKSFPYLIEHTLVWARDWFEGEFAMLPAAINAYISDPAFLDKLALQPGQQIETLQRLLAALVKEKPTTVEDCVKWARLRFAAAYHDDMLQLLHNFPADKVNSDGQPFWNQTNKRVPHAVHFDDGDATCMDFVRAVTELRAAMFGLRVDPAMHTPEWYRQALAAVKVPAFQALSGVKIAASEKEAEELKAAEAAGGGGGAATGGGGGGGGGWDATSVAEGLIAQLPKPSDLAGFRCFEAEFEKDDDLHITAVTASSNLRARAYTIAEQGKFESKRIAGKVIPAIATTTAFVSGVICAELYKLTKGGLPLESFRSSGNNLAVPVFGFSEPVGLQFKRNKLTLPTRATFAPQPPALPLEPAEGGTKVWKWSVWDANVDVQGPLTMQGLLDFVATTFGRDDVESIGFGTTILHTTMAFMKKAQKEARLKATPAQLVKQIQKDQAPDFSKVRAIELPVNTRSDDEMGQLPTLLYHISSDELAAIGVVVAEGEPPVPAAVTPAAAADGAA
jgi:ubiquitin-activating enzyme E1